MATLHIIGRQIVEVHIEPGMDGFGLQEEISRILQGPVRQAVEELFTRHTDEDVFVRLDRVEIDVARLDYSRLEDDLVRKVVGALERLLTERQAVGLLSRPASNDSIRSSEEHVFELWRYYLDHGYFPWWAAPQRPEDFEREVLHALRIPALARRTHETLSAALSARRRLTVQFSDEFLAALLDIYVSTLGTRLARFAPAVLDGIDWPTVPEGSRAAIREAIWQESLEAVFGRSVSAPPRSLEEIAEALVSRMSGGTVTLRVDRTENQEIKLLAARVRAALEQFDEFHTKGISEEPSREDPAGVEKLKEWKTLDQAPEQGARLKPPTPETGTAPRGAGTSQESEPSEGEDPTADRASEARNHSSPDSDRAADDSTRARIRRKSRPEAKSSRERLDTSATGAGRGTRSSEVSVPGESSSAKSTAREPASEESTTEDQDSLYISNAGIVLLHPFLPLHFEYLELIREEGFVDEQARERAIHQLHYLATGETQQPEYTMTLPKLLCGFLPADTIRRRVEVEAAMKAEADELLDDVISHWEALKNTSRDGLREGFLQRDGKLTRTPNGWKLQVEQRSIDILLGRMPWAISLVKYPWMPEILHVEWA